MAMIHAKTRTAVSHRAALVIGAHRIATSARPATLACPAARRDVSMASGPEGPS
jgi:hypothetical protein